MIDPFDDFPGRVKRAALAVVVIAVLATAGLLGIVLVLPDEATTALRWWLLVVGATGLVAAAWVAAKVYPIHGQTSFDLAQARSSTPSRLPERLWQIERLVAAAGWDRREFQARLRPVLWEIAAQRLATYQNIDIAAEPERARTIIGDSAWALLTTQVSPRDGGGPGIGPGELRMMVEALERIDDSDYGLN